MRQRAFYRFYLLVYVTIEKRKKVNVVMRKLKTFIKKWGFFLIVPLIFILTFDYRMIQPNIVERPENSIYDPNHRLNQDTEDELLRFNRNNETQLTANEIELNKEKFFSTPTSEMVKNIPSEDLLGMSGAIILIVFMAILNFIPLIFIGLLVLLFIIGFINHKKESKNKEFKLLGVDLAKVVFVPAKHSSSKTKWDSQDSSIDDGSSSSSGSDWGGGGFDGGGSSSSW